MIRHLHDPRGLWATIVALVVTGLLVGAVQADDEDTLRTQREAQERAFEALQADLEASRQTEAALAAEIEELRGDRTALNERLLETAQKERETEARIGLLENRIEELQEREATVRRSLSERSGLLSELLGALQRMGRRPPPAVVVRPEDALTMVRSAMLLGAVMPEIRMETAALATDLEELTGLRREIDEERQTLIAETERLERERAEVALLIDAKRRDIEDGEEELGTLRIRAAELEEEMEDAQEVMAALDREISVASREAMERARQRTAQESLEALRDPGRLEPAIAFESAEGLLPKPVSGPVVRDFGAPDELNAPARGVSIAASPSAQVISPSDGWVVYAGPFRSYGQLLIVNVGDGYHIVLAGMSYISVELGQFVLKGEPVGRMDSVILASATDVTVDRQRPVLYVEFRKDGDSIDPAPWWAEGRTGASG
jgi:murein hydrolase activator